MIDFENGINLPVTLRKTTKNYSDTDGLKDVQGTIDVYYFEMNQGTSKDLFVAKCLEELDYCYNPAYELHGIEFIAFAGFPIAKHIRVYFSEPSSIHEEFHFYIMSMDHEATYQQCIDKTFELAIVPRDEEELHGSV